MPENYTKEELSELPFMDDDLELEERVEDLLKRLTFKEKLKFFSGKMLFFTRRVNRLGIKSFKMTDGPTGVGALGTFFLKKTTYFPVAICRAATWNPELSRQFGIAVAQEVRDVGRHCLLAPGINIDRTPLCGRTFEYQTEDPYLNKKLAVAMVEGLQSQRVAACLKHYVANNQEKWRFTVSSEVDERALHEIYFPAFKAAVQEADAWSVMACYNKVNGVYGCENKSILNDTLMDEWGFRGFVVSDWYATKFTTTDGCMNAGLSLEMPGFPFGRYVYSKNKIRDALDQGLITEKVINENLRRLLRVMFLVGMFDEEDKIPEGSRNTKEHQDTARRIATEGMVLLKNQGDLLPLDIEKIQKLAVIGPNANKKYAFGGGSSMIRTTYEITPFKGIKEKCKGEVKIITNSNKVSEADAVVLIAGLNHKKHNDMENSDRKSLDLPEKQVKLITQVAKENPNTIVVLINGSPIAMDDWIGKVPAILEAWYGGLEAGNVIADIIFGDINPSGKLPITFPRKLSDSPAHKSKRTYPGIEKIIEGKKGKRKFDRRVYYEEGIFVGYRHYDQNDIEPLFPFGYGLSYTNFIYEKLEINKKQMSSDLEDRLEIKFEIKNTGNRSGAETAQLYIEDVESSVERPPKELKGFKKLYLEPNESKTVKFEITMDDLSYYDVKSNSWKAEKGEYKILIGSSSRNILLDDTIEYLS
ncbi:MAG: glycosyl hydrolase [Candidatus Lokiarchaeota archaeon]|nr:glycosyl hydrolase [Candidatus Lokiarchaeota archaeon]